MGMKQRNPLECVSFYTERDGSYVSIKKQLSEISLMMPEKCQATIVRLFLKDENKFSQAKLAFKTFC